MITDKQLIFGGGSGHGAPDVVVTSSPELDGSLSIRKALAES